MENKTTASEVIQLMRLVGTEKMRLQLEKMERDNQNFLTRLRDLFSICKRDNDAENQP